MNIMKILFFVDDFIGGAGNVVELLSGELQSRGHEVIIALTRQSAASRRALDQIRIITLNENWKKQNSIIRAANLLSRISRTIRDTFPDVVISFLFGVNSLVGLCCPTGKTKLIVSERSNPLMVYPSAFWELLRRHAYKKAEAVVVQFDAFKFFDGGRYLDKVATIPNPIERPAFCHNRRIACDGYYRFVTLGNDRPIKGFKYLIQGFEKVRATHDNVRLEIYGNSVSNENARLIRELGLSEYITFKGYTSDIASALNNNDFYIMPSLQEGFPNALCEAMAVGMPCAASLCHAGIGELICSGFNGITFDPGRSDAVAAAMLSLIDNPEKASNMGVASKSAVDKYSISQVANLWEQLI